MLKILKTLVVIGLGVQQISAQGTLENLESKLATEKNDSARFVLLLDLSREAEYFDYSKARKFANEASVLSQALGTDWAKAKLFARLAFLEKIEGDYTEALRYSLQCANLYSSLKDTLMVARSLNNAGINYRDLGEYDAAYFNLTQSYRTAKNRRRIHTHDDSLVMAIALHNIATIFTQLGQVENALGHLQAAARMSDAIHDTLSPPYTLNEMGEVYRRKGEFDQSEKYFLDALEQARKLRIRVQVPRILANLATLYRDMKDYERSLQYYDSVIDLQTNVNNQFGLAECNLGKGMVMARSGNFSEALNLFSKSLVASKGIKARNLTVASYKELADLYEVKKDFEKSLKYHQQHDALRDSIFSEAAMEKLFQNQVRFETEVKDMEIASLSRLQQKQTGELRRQELVRNILVIVVALAVILLYSVYRSSQRRKRINRLLMEHQEEIKRRSIELEQLNKVKDKFFSIISHDLRSPMNALSGTLNLLDQRNISQDEFTGLTQTLKGQFNHTRTLINNLLDWTLLQMDKLKIQQEKVTLKEKVEESFDALRNLYQKKITMENNVADDVSGRADPNILNLILRNLILNAIKFTQSGGRIWVDAKEKEHDIVVSVSDNGIGIKPEVREVLFEKTSGYSTRGTANEKGTGLGLILCKEFVEKNGGKIWLDSEPGIGTTFYFTLPKA